jgi:hypothetical protein
VFSFLAQKLRCAIATKKSHFKNYPIPSFFVQFFSTNPTPANLLFTFFQTIKGARRICSSSSALQIKRQFLQVTFNWSGIWGIPFQSCLVYSLIWGENTCVMKFVHIWDFWGEFKNLNFNAFVFFISKLLSVIFLNFRVKNQQYLIYT